MGWTGQLLIVLALFSLGCARGDWTTETLTLVDVTGAWEGPVRWPRSPTLGERTIMFRLQQKGQKVRGEAQAADGRRFGTVEGLVNGEAFSWQLTGSLTPGRDSAETTYHGVFVISGDEFSGRADGPMCPCTFLLRRVSPQAIGEKKTQ